MIPSDVEQQIKNHAIEDYPNESVGLLLDDDTYIRVKNIHKKPQQHFQIATVVFQGYLPRLKAIVHSHPNQKVLEPSLDDQQLIVSYKTTGGIVRVVPDPNTKEPQASPITWWGAIPNRNPQPLEGREFVYGITDCFGIVRDWYYMNRSIVLYDMPRTYGWWDDQSHPCWNMIENNVEAMGFKKHKYQSASVRRGDVMFMSLRSKLNITNHLALYEGGDSIIHHLPSSRGSLKASLSKRDILSRYIPYITGIARWEQ